MCVTQVAAAEGGPRRHVAQLMVALAGQGHFGEPMHHHLLHVHHHPLHPAAGPHAVKTVVRFDGWAAIPQGQLPAGCLSRGCAGILLSEIK